MKFLCLSLSLILIVSCGSKDNDLDSNGAVTSEPLAIVGISFVNEAPRILQNLERVQSGERKRLHKDAGKIKRYLVDRADRSFKRTLKRVEKLQKNLNQVSNKLVSHSNRNENINSQLAQLENGSVCDQSRITFYDQFGIPRIGQIRESAGQCRNILKRHRSRIQRIKNSQRSYRRSYDNLRAKFSALKQKTDDFALALRFLILGGNSQTVNMPAKTMAFFRSQNELEVAIQ